ncbi:MAG: radical SAM protein, partial [Planctomycetes bacterium]|nr:radical SAM protein [Planctomycetota bacterium]
DLADVDGLQRLRMITLHPSYVTKELSEAMARSPQFMRFLPIPLQSGSDRILRAMKRGYDVGLYAKRIDLLRTAMPDLELISDWIVGFPGETDEDFQQSKLRMDEFGFLQSYVFQYSPRPGTTAFDMPDDVEAEVKKQRNIEMLDLQRKIARRRSPLWVGKESTMILEQVAKHQPEHWSGRTHNGHPAILPFTEGLVEGALVPIKMHGHNGRSLLAQVTGPAFLPLIPTPSEPFCV